MKIKYILFSYLLFSISICSAQYSFTRGFMPTVNMSFDSKKDWSYKVKFETRNKFDNGIDCSLIDLSFITSKKIGLKNKLSAGYSYLVSNENDAHRFIQQFSMIKQYRKYIMAYRLASDQTITNRNFALRCRMKISTLIPFKGVSVDTGEFYLKASNEYLNKFYQKYYQLEFRLSPLLGYQISKQNKIELGIDHRIKSFLKANSQSNYWLKVNWYIKI
ncbi:DUF2490 domain-containing protein [Labilibacter sediminis]|nr:DUF2490 domain-containing protein [Labilibacter sediminis]